MKPAAETSRSKGRRRRRRTGRGVFNNILSNLPFELHLPGGYQYCGPGTKLQQRLARGDPGINPLDRACRDHDVAYSNSRELTNRHAADKVLTEQAWRRVLAKDAGIGEKVAAWSVANAMKAKVKFGLGVRKKKTMTSRTKGRKRGRRRNNSKKGKNKPVPFSSIKRAVKTSLLTRGALSDSDIIDTDTIKMAVKTARSMARGGRRSIIKRPRIIPIPKRGGLLPLIPIFAGLSALGALSGGAAGIAKAVTTAQRARKELEEAKRHNQTMEAIAIGGKRGAGGGGGGGRHDGSGLYLKPHRKGLGLYLAPPRAAPSKNH